MPGEGGGAPEDWNQLIEPQLRFVNLDTEQLYYTSLIPNTSRTVRIFTMARLTIANIHTVLLQIFYLLLLLCIFLLNYAI